MKKFLLFILLLFTMFLLVWYSSRQKSAESEAKRQKVSADSILALKDFIQIQKDSIERLNCCLNNTIDSLRISDREKNKHIETIEEEKTKQYSIIRSRDKALKDKEQAMEERNQALEKANEANENLKLELEKERLRNNEIKFRNITRDNNREKINFNLNQ